MFQSISGDWRDNTDARIRVVLVLYRIGAGLWRSNRFVRAVSFPYFAFYRITVEWLLGIELGVRVDVGRRLRIFHGFGLVIHPDARIGSDCVLRHCTTIGSKVDAGGAPTIGDGVDVGSNVVILGEIRVGDHAVIGAGSVVIHDVPANAVVAGNPARVLRIKGGLKDAADRVGGATG